MQADTTGSTGRSLQPECILELQFWIGQFLLSPNPLKDGFETENLQVHSWPNSSINLNDMENIVTRGSTN